MRRVASTTIYATLRFYRAYPSVPGPAVLWSMATLAAGRPASRRELIVARLSGGY